MSDDRETRRDWAALGDDAETLKRALERLPPALLRALTDARRRRLPLCEEVILSVWLKAPLLFGPGAGDLLERIAPGADRGILESRVARALRALEDACVVEDPGAATSRQIERLLLRGSADSERPATLLSALAVDPFSLLQRLLPNRPVREAPGDRCPIEEVPALVVLSGASAGHMAPLDRGAALGVGRDPGRFGPRPLGLSVRDQTIPRWSAETAPLRVTWTGGAIRLAATKGALRVRPGALTPPSDLFEDMAAEAAAPKDLNVPLGPDGVSFLYGSTLFAVTFLETVELRSDKSHRIYKKINQIESAAADPPAHSAAGKVEPITILFLCANPTDTAWLRLDKEIKLIRQRLLSAKLRDHFKIEHVWAVNREEIQEHLLSNRPTIVHFSGHGSPSGEILFQDDDGHAAPVKPDTLAELFRILRPTHNIRCVVLNACYSKKQAEAIAEHVDFVVGMSREIADRAAIAFVGALYQALGAGESIRTAFELGCHQIDLSELHDQDVPRLLQRNGAVASEARLLSSSARTGAP